MAVKDTHLKFELHMCNCLKRRQQVLSQKACCVAFFLPPHAYMPCMQSNQSTDLHAFIGSIQERDFDSMIGGGLTFRNTVVPPKTALYWATNTRAFSMRKWAWPQMPHLVECYRQCKPIYKLYQFFILA